MDNFTHTLAGLAVAEAALALRRTTGAKTEPAFVRAAWLTSALANNVPDADLLLSPLTESPYGYMLHHRGHTHTLLLAPLVGLLAWGLALVFARRRGARFTTVEHAFLLGLGTLGGVLHIAMDATNSYGVHPFWPLDDHWYAADLIFIVEPIWWLVLAIPLSFSVRALSLSLASAAPVFTERQAKWGRIGLLGIAGLGLVLAVFTGYVSNLAIGWLLLLAVALYAWSRRLKTGGGRAALALFGTALMFASFAAGRVIADGRVRNALNGAFSHAIEADVILSPEPGNPLCWNAIAVSEERGDLLLRRVHVSSSSLVHPVGLCRMPFSEETMARREPIARSETEDIRFVDEVRTPLALLRAMNEEDCRASAFFRFSRAPFFVERDGARFLGDLRYDRGGEGFAVARLPEHADGCPENVPAWVPWRAEVLAGPLPEEEHRFEALDF